MKADEFAEAARVVRAMLEELPPTTPTDRALARRLEGAAVTLDALARVPQTIE